VVQMLIRLCCWIANNKATNMSGETIANFDQITCLIVKKRHQKTIEEPKTYPRGSQAAPETFVFTGIMYSWKKTGYTVTQRNLTTYINLPMICSGSLYFHSILFFGH
jgi:hypothetical protein